jgi:hypothetical protein
MGTPYIKIFKDDHIRLLDGYTYIVKPVKTEGWIYAEICYAGQLRFSIRSYNRAKLWKVDTLLMGMQTEDFMYYWQRHYHNWNDNPEVWVIELELIGIRPN